MKKIADKSMAQEEMEKKSFIMKKLAIKRRNIRCILFIVCLICLIVNITSVSYAAKDDYSVTFSMPENDDDSVSSTIQILIVLTVLSLAPAIVILLTSFTRIIVVLHFTRSALGTQTTPPNQVLIGLALFLTLFIMSPVFLEINNKAIKPLNEGKISYEKAFEEGMEPVRKFMFKQTRKTDIKLFADIAKIDTKEKPVKELSDIPNAVLIPAFIISELRIGFIIGFLIYIPFIIVDMVVSSTLMSMGMMMLPPTVISLPFKILLFILADGWNLVIGNLVKTFY
jgi:flagellar biosynthetic protein FliP